MARLQISVRLSPELKQAIAAKAETQGLGLNEWIVQALTLALDSPATTLVPGTATTLLPSPDITALEARVAAIEALLAAGTPTTRTTPTPPPPPSDLKGILSQIRKKLITPEQALELIPHPHPPDLLAMLGKVKNSVLGQGAAREAIEAYQKKQTPEPIYGSGVWGGGGMGLKGLSVGLQEMCHQGFSLRI